MSAITLPTPDFFKTLNTTAVSTSSLSFSNGSLNILGLPNPINPMDIISYSSIAYAAGTKSVWAITLQSLMVIADLTEYQITVSRLITGEPKGLSPQGSTAYPVTKRTYQVFSGVSTTADQMKTLFINAIVADTQAFVVATSGGTGIITLTASDTLTDFVVDITKIPASTQSNTTPYVAPAGTPAVVATIDTTPANVSASAHYTTYIITYRTSRISGLVENSYVKKPQTVIVFADSLQAGYAAFNQMLINALVNATISNLLAVGSVIPTPNIVPISTTLLGTLATVTAGIIGGNISSTSAAGVTLTMDSVANMILAYAAIGITITPGQWVDFIIDNSGGSSTVTLAVDSGATWAVTTPVITGGATLTVSTANVYGYFRLYFTSATTGKVNRII
jgi:hypothetical protein